MPSARTLLHSLSLFALCLGIGATASASTFTHSGAFTADNDVYEYSFNVPTMQTYTFNTTSYGGGANLDGTTSAAGGFVPVLSLFNGAGGPAGNAGGSGDAYLQLALAAGSYTLALTEFPNVAINNLSDGFLFASDPNATGTVCGQAGGTFLDSTVAPCAQRNGNYAVNVSSASPVPEPPTWALMLPAAGVLFFAGRQHLS